MNNEVVLNIKNMSRWMRQEAINMAYAAGDKGAHLGAGLSSIELLACLYGGCTNIKAEINNIKERDVFIPSKAHCVLSFYTALAYAGFFPKEDLNHFEENESELPGHPIMNARRGIEFSGGSLGMGLSQGVGMALGAKRKKYNSKIYVLLGDGECDEGSIWEAAMSAAHFELDNLVVIVDCNGLQYDGETKEIMRLYSLEEKFKSFGFECYTIDGHNVEEIYACLETCQKGTNNKPKAILAQTIKGKGISFMENKKEWHHAVLTEEQYKVAISELEEAKNDI